MVHVFVGVRDGVVTHRTERGPCPPSGNTILEAKAGRKVTPCGLQQGSGWLSDDEDTSLVIPDLGPDGRLPDGEGRESLVTILALSLPKRQCHHPQGPPTATTASVLT